VGGGILQDSLLVTLKVAESVFHLGKRRQVVVHTVTLLGEAEAGDFVLEGDGSSWDVVGWCEAE
jgi:hypothetical protein